MAELLLLLLSAALFNNFVLAQFLGLCPFMGVTQSKNTAIAMSFATAFVLTLAATLGWLLYHGVLVPLELTYLNIIVYIVVIAATVQFTELYLRATSPLVATERAFAYRNHDVCPGCGTRLFIGVDPVCRIARAAATR